MTLCPTTKSSSPLQRNVEVSLQSGESKRWVDIWEMLYICLEPLFYR